MRLSKIDHMEKAFECQFLFKRFKLRCCRSRPLHGNLPSCLTCKIALCYAVIMFRNTVVRHKRLHGCQTNA